MLKRMVSAAVIVMVSTMAAQSAETVATVYHKKGSYADIRQEVADGIARHGFVVDYTAHIGEMLNRTGKDVGAPKPLYANAEALQFCPAKLSRDMFDADPASIVLCPQVVVVYEMAAAPGVIHVGYRKMPQGVARRSRAAQAAMTKVLDDIARKATH